MERLPGGITSHLNVRPRVDTASKYASRNVADGDVDTVWVPD